MPALGGRVSLTLATSALVAACAADPPAPSSDNRATVVQASALEIRTVQFEPPTSGPVTAGGAGAHRPIALGYNVGGLPDPSAPSAFKSSGADTIALYSMPGEADSSDSAAFHGGQIIDSADVQLIFWGNEWSTLTSPSAGAIANGMNAMLASSYFDNMRQYGLTSLHMRGPIQVLSDPPSNFQFEDIGNMVWGLIDQGTFPEPDEPGGKILYLVVTPYSANTGISGTPRGAHAAPGDYDFPGGWTYAWVAWAGYGSVDFVTKVLSHEMVEAISDPEPFASAWLMNRTINGGQEIADACTQIVDRIDGVDVTAYFSQVDHLCAIPFPAGPTVTYLSNSAGPPAGGTSIRIDGTGFDTTGHTRVTFGGVPALSVSCPNSTQCYVTSPPGNGLVDVVVTRNWFSSPTSDASKFGYSPSVTSIEPTAGNPGDVVTIHGIGFSWAPGATTIRFGNALATSSSCYPGPDCWAIVPPGASTVDVVVTVNGTPTVPWLNDRFTYAPSAITRIDTSNGSIAGGTYVNLYGNGFDPALGGTRVWFGNVEASYVQCDRSTTCYVRSPPGADYGGVYITFSAFGITSAPTAAAWFTYVPAALRSIVYYPYSYPASASVSLNGYAPPGGVNVTFASGDPSALAAPAPLWIPPGSTGTSATATLLPIDHAETVTLTASDGTVSVSTPVSLFAWPVFSLQVGAAVLGQNESTTLAASLASAAPAGGATVSLSSSDPAAIAVPATVTIAAGSHQAIVPITNNYGGAPKDVTLTATYNGQATTASVSVPSDTSCVRHTCRSGWYWNTADCLCEQGPPQ